MISSVYDENDVLAATILQYAALSFIVASPTIDFQYFQEMGQ